MVDHIQEGLISCGSITDRHAWTRDHSSGKSPQSVCAGTPDVLHCAGSSTQGIFLQKFSSHGEQRLLLEKKNNCIPQTTQDLVNSKERELCALRLSAQVTKC